MESIVNRFGERITKWESHIHPDNPNFMQVVRYMHVEYKDGRNHLYWRLCNSSLNDTHMITNISLSDAQKLYIDKEEVEITEEMFQEWLKNN